LIAPLIWQIRSTLC